jgi:hypothetical protein
MTLPLMIDRFCVRCRSQISEKRVARGSCFCSDECRRQDRIVDRGKLEKAVHFVRILN